ncbi:AMP-binding protein [Patulibacter sp. NPDC049589]|uniref:AMP-binding protein n=1 Tax=Patulibacter sp. NPDC049589 TaxID=3154731 RepID=UPI00343D8B9D
MPSRSFLDRLARTIRERPDDRALTWTRGDLSFGELADLIDDAAAALEASVDPGDRLFVVGAKSADLVALLVAAWRNGHRVVLPSPQLGETTLAALAVQSSADRLVRLAARAAGDIGPGIPALRVAPVVGATAVSDPAAAAALSLTTSGTTGTPKIVPIPSAASTRFETWAAEAFDLGPGVRVLSYAPLNFDLSLLDVWSALSHGAEVVLVDPAEAADPAVLAGLVGGRDVHVVQGVPLLFRLLADSSGSAAFPSVRDVVLTGDRAPSDLAAHLPELFPNARVRNVYGSTETNDSVWHEVAHEHLRAAEPIPIGRPIPGAEVRVVDATGAVVPEDAAGEGELWTSTPFQSTGYAVDPGGPPRFAADPAGGPRIFFRTGDLVRRDDAGLLTLRGRQDHEVKVRGVRTNLAEVEHVLRDAEGVEDAAVLAVGDRVAGQVLHAVVQRRPGLRVDGLALRSACAQRLPRTAIPSAFTVTDLPLARTATGKLDRHAIRTAHIEETPRVPTA